MQLVNPSYQSGFCVVRLVFVCISTVDIRLKGLTYLWYQDTWLQDGCVCLPSKLCQVVACSHTGQVNSQLWTRFGSHLLLPLVNNSFSPPPLGRAAPGTESGWRERNTHLVPRSQALYGRREMSRWPPSSYAQAVGTRPFSPSHTRLGKQTKR